MAKYKDPFILAILFVVYLLCGIRYFPEQPQKTLYNTALHLLTIAPFIIGSLLIINSLIKRAAGEKLSVVKIARIYLAIGITIEFFLGIYNYLKIYS